MHSALFGYNLAFVPCIIDGIFVNMGPCPNKRIIGDWLMFMDAYKSIILVVGLCRNFFFQFTSNYNAFHLNLIWISLSLYVDNFCSMYTKIIPLDKSIFKDGYNSVT